MSEKDPLAKTPSTAKFTRFVCFFNVFVAGFCLALGIRDADVMDFVFSALCLFIGWSQYKLA